MSRLFPGWLPGLLWLLLVAGPAAALDRLDETGWRDLLASHAGRPLIVHFWGVTCAPCLAELPAWGRLAAGHPELPLVLVQDDPLPIDARRIDRLLAGANLAKVPAFSLAVGDERTPFAIDPDWAGELPMTLLIGPDGRQQRRAGVVEPAEIFGWLSPAAGRTQP